MAVQNESGDARLNAVHGNLIHSLDQALHTRRQTLQEEERQSRVGCHSSRDRGVREEQASRGLRRDRGCGITTTCEEGDFPQRSSGLAGMDDQPASTAATDDPYFPLEDERNSFRAVTSG